jgi:hypothetical protein
MRSNILTDFFFLKNDFLAFNSLKKTKQVLSSLRTKKIETDKKKTKQKKKMCWVSAIELPMNMNKPK